MLYTWHTLYPTRGHVTIPHTCGRSSSPEGVRSYYIIRTVRLTSNFAFIRHGSFLFSIDEIELSLPYRIKRNILLYKKKEKYFFFIISKKKEIFYSQYFHNKL